MVDRGELGVEHLKGQAQIEVACADVALRDLLLIDDQARHQAAAETALALYWAVQGALDAQPESA